MRLTALVLAAVAAAPAAAWAHGEVRPGRAAAGVTVEAALLVPSERKGHGNAAIALSLPPGFAAVACRAPTGWTCSLGRSGIVWQRDRGPDAEEFGLTMRTGGGAGTYAMPLAQTYDDGQTNTFAGDPRTRDAAPVFTTTGSSSVAPSVELGPGPSAAAALPPGRLLAPPSSSPGATLAIAAAVVAGTALAGAVLVVRRRWGEDPPPAA